MSVADDPESLRAKKSQNQLSSLKYHGKDRTNPASTPLSRPAFSSPGKYGVVRGRSHITLSAEGGGVSQMIMLM